VALLSWNPSLSLGIASIDRQHERELDLINNLHNAILAGRGSQVAAATLDELLEYTIYHFRFEEGMLRAQGFPGLDAHVREHQAFTRTLTHMAESREVRHVRTLMNTLSQWLHGHIMGIDMQYASYIRERRAA
jgi:hemerythrin-like metal-binding protein